MTSGNEFTVRPALAVDCKSIAEAHVVSIRSLGAKAYDPELVDDWSARLTGELNRRAMEKGVLFFVAVERNSDPDERILAFSSYKFEEGKHRTAVYVRGDVARRGVGTALLTSAESAARQHGAVEINVDASLAGVEFYKSNGFHELGTGEHKLKSGRRMSCVFMRKHL